MEGVLYILYVCRLSNWCPRGLEKSEAYGRKHADMQTFRHTDRLTERFLVLHFAILKCHEEIKLHVYITREQCILINHDIKEPWVLGCNDLFRNLRMRRINNNNGHRKTKQV